MASGAWADETCQAGAYTVSTPGPIVSGSSTSITYRITGSISPDHVATVVGTPSNDCFTRGITAVTGSTPTTGNQSYAPAVGDPITGLGKMACHEEAAKINPTGSVVNFTVTVSGARSQALKSVAVKRGATIKSCAIVGIGDQSESSEGTPAPVSEIIKEPGSECAVEFTLDRLTGKVLHVDVVAGSAPNCTLTQTPVEDLNLSISGLPTCTSATQPNCCPPDKVNQDGTCAYGSGKFGQGYLHTGSQSCTTRVVGGTLYSWGAPCP